MTSPMWSSGVVTSTCMRSTPCLPALICQHPCFHIAVRTMKTTFHELVPCGSQLERNDSTYVRQRVSHAVSHWNIDLLQQAVHSQPALDLLRQRLDL